MNILITGGNGLIGTELVKKLKEKNHEIRILTRKKNNHKDEFYWNINEKQIDDAAFKNLDAVIHLAGASISKRWTESYKKELYSSRIDTANLIKSYIEKHKIILKSYISASGINFYGTFTSDEILDEKKCVIKEDFLAQLCVEWEKSAENFSDIAKKIVCVRTAMVLAKKDGAFPKLKKITDFNLCSALGSGKQWMNWIHLDDLVNIYISAIENEEIEGKINAVADEIPRNKEFMKILANVSKKVFLPIAVPAFLLKILFGEMSIILLEGSVASNEKLKKIGFIFKYQSLRKAFKSLM